MRKTKLILYLLITSFIFSSCKKVIEEINKVPETDYKVIDFDYGFDNYIKNIRDNDLDPIKIKERNLVEIIVGENGECLIKDTIVEANSIVSELKKYLIANPENNEMPITIQEEFKYAGKITVNKNLLVVASFDKGLNYKKYSEIRNKIHQAYNEVRNEFAVKKYEKKFS